MNTVLYTDGTEVRKGDCIRYHQAPGGLLPPPSQNGQYLWREGVAMPHPQYQSPEERRAAISVGMDPDELMLRDDKGYFYGLAGHVIERA